MRRTTPRDTVLVSVIGQNCLAAEYLHQILEKDRAIHVALLDDLTNQVGRETVSPILVLNSCGLPLPLSECVWELRIRHRRAKYLVLDRARSNEDIIRLLWFGVHGFLAHHEVGKVLLRAVRAVAQGRLWFSPEVLEEYAQYSGLAHRNGASGREAMTTRERQIIELVKRRLSNREIASILGIRESTVKFHLSNIFSKLQVSNRRALLDKPETQTGWVKLLDPPSTSHG